MINYGKQFINKDDIDSVIEILKSDFLTQGPTVEIFENLVSSRVGCNHGVAVNSATSALHIACIAIGLKTGDYFWTVPNTFVASANCGLHCGATVDFVDIDKETFNISIIDLKKKLIIAEKNNCLPKVVITVHFAGQPTLQEEIYKLSKKYNFKIIEDASHSLGSENNDNITGSCKWSDISIFSFHPVKMITTGEGGMAVTNDQTFANKMRSLRTHGILKDPELMELKDQPNYYYEQKYLGFNYRMTDIAAALGISQLDKLNDFVQQRNKLAKRYDDLFLDLPFRPQKIIEGIKSSYHLYVIKIDNEYLKIKSRDDIYNSLIANGIGTNLHYLPVHLHPYYKSLGFYKGQFAESEEYANSALSIPLYYSLDDSDQDKISNIFHKVFL